MVFILSKDIVSYKKNESENYEDFEIFKIQWLNYQKYLKSNKEKIPSSAYDFATAEWHYNTMDARCLHDSWLEEYRFGEVSESQGKFKLKSTKMYLKLLGAYHNGYLKIHYKNLKEYSLKSNRDFFAPVDFKGFVHHDLLHDEVRLSESGFVIHEIEWVNANWIIECEDIFYEWIPFIKDQSNDMTPFL